MADCQNIATPKMIRAGQVSVGDRINLEEEVIEAHSPAVSSARPNSQQNSNSPSSNNEAWRNNNAWAGNNTPPSNNMWANSGEAVVRRILPFEEMTAYMEGTVPSGTMENPSVILPLSPLAPNGYQEEIENTALQSFNGFLRTQIGRYMRVEQLVTSDRTEDRLGFLVGVGSNFIILQDITTGNILVIDIFSIRLTYVYYSPAVVPQF